MQLFEGAYLRIWVGVEYLKRSQGATDRHIVGQMFIARYVRASMHGGASGKKKAAGYLCFV